MRTGTVSYKLEDLRKGVIIPIGMVGENDFTRVIFDAEEVFKKHPDAQVTMKVQPPKGGIYPATVTRDGNSVIWQVKAADVANRGSGELQLTFTADTMVEKSYIAKTDIKRSLVGNGPAPDPVQDWLDEAQEALEDIESAEVHQPIIGNDGYWYRWDAEAGEYVTTGTKAQGADGQPGQDGAPGRDGTDATPNLITKDYADLTFPVAEGTYCYHSGMLYYAKQDIQTSEAWTAAHWQQTTVEEQQRLLKNAIQGLGQEVEEIYITAQTSGTAESGSYTWVSCALTKGIKYKIKITASKPYNSDIEFSTAGSNQVYVTNPVGTLPANKTEVEIIHTPTTKDIAYIRFKVARSDSCVYTIKTYHLESSELSADIDALNDDALLPGSASQITSSNYTDFFTDANHAPMGKTFSINSNVTSAMIANLPSYGNTSILCTIPSMKGYDHGRVQIFSNSTGNVWFRFESGYDNIYNYTPWNAPTALNKMTCKIFKKVVCCGDSYTSGHINTTGTAVDTNEDFAWPHYMETATGNEWVNCGVSGANVLTWQSAQRGLLKAQSCGKAQAYVIGLGLNDSDTSGQAHVDVGTSADIGTEEQTYYGGLSKIIRELNTINPTAKIFVNTIPNNSSQYTAYNTAIRTIVEAYKGTYPVYLMDLEANRLLYYNPTLLNDRVNGHYTALGYEQFAEIYAFLLSDYITSHFWSFQNVYAIPYDAGSGT